MMLITGAQRKKLLANGAKRLAHHDKFDPKPVVKLFNPTGAATWLLTELDPEYPDLAFGLCDLGMGSPELGFVRISELTAVRGRFGLGIERDIHFTADKPLSEYTKEATTAGRIVD